MGVNDCEARLGVIAVERVWRLLRKLGRAGEGPCFELP